MKKLVNAVSIFHGIVLCVKFLRDQTLLIRHVFLEKDGIQDAPILLNCGRLKWFIGFSI